MSEPRRLEPSVWEVPIGYVEGMRVPGIVFASDELFARAVEDRAVEQVANVATLPGIVGASYAMPDIHWGYGFPIGGVAATDPADGGVVSPGGVGFDIGCGVRLLRSDLDWDTDVRGRIGDLVGALARRIPRGPGGAGLVPVDRAGVDRVLLEGVRYTPEPCGRGREARSPSRWRLHPRRRPAQVSDRASARGARTGQPRRRHLSCRCRSSTRSATPRPRPPWALRPARCA